MTWKIFVRLIFACTVLPSPAQTRVPANQRTLIVISLDGFPAYALEDPQLPVPILRRLMREGSSSRRMTPINPTVTWPNHTAMVTGVHAATHGLLVNGSLVPSETWPPVKIDASINKTAMVRAPTVYDLAQRAGLTTAEIDWVAINRAPTITWHFPELASPEGTLEREMIEHGVISREDVDQFSKTNILMRDEIWAKAAVYLIRQHKPNLLLLHFLTLDSIHHRYGPKSLAGQAAMAFLDRCVAELLEAVNSAGLTDRATVVVVSDHGFKAFDKQIRLSLAFAAAGLADTAYVLPEGGSAMVYVKKPAEPGLLAKLLRTLDGVEGIERIASREDFPALGLPDPGKDRQMPELIVYAKTGFAFANGKDGPTVIAAPQTGGAHGYLASDPDMDAIFVAWGYGIRRGIVLDRIRNVDVAPTLASLLGITLPKADGKSLQKILQ